MPGSDRMLVSAWSTRAGSTPSRSLRPMSRAMLISRPIRGSARGKPAQTPITPSATAREVKPSARAWTPSATRAADPILRPVRISVERDEYVACEPDEAGRQDPAEPGKWLGSKEMADGFVTGEDRG